MNLPNTILSGFWKEGHVQGIAVDTQRGFVYYSFTTILLKTDLEGNPLTEPRTPQMQFYLHLGKQVPPLTILRHTVDLSAK